MKIVGSRNLSASELERLQQSSRVEAGLAGRKTTAFVGNIPDGINDELLEQLLGACGTVLSWKRVKDAANMPKSFGFCDFFDCDGLMRALRLLDGVALISGRKLIVKVDDQTKAFLKQFEEALRGDGVEQTSAEVDQEAVKICGDLLKAKGLYSAVEDLEGKLKAEGHIEEKTGSSLESVSSGSSIQSERLNERRDSREQAREVSRERRKSVNHEQIFRDREARWEAREEQLHAARRRTVHQEEEQARRAQEAEYAYKYLGSFDDSHWNSSSLNAMLGLEVPQLREAPEFYADRAGWAHRRQRELQREETDDHQIILEMKRRAAEQMEECSQRSVARPERLFPAKRRPSGDLISLVDKRTGKRRPLVSVDYSVQELRAAGYSTKDIQAKMQEAYKEKVAALIQAIPTEADQLFRWDIDWRHYEETKCLAIIQKKLPQLEDSVQKKIWRMIGERMPPKDILERINLDVEMLALIWRFLVWETEANAYGIQVPPKFT